MRNLLIAFTFLLITVMVPAQNTFEISYATDEDEYISDGIIDQQGNTILTGQIGSYTDARYDAIIMKIYSNGGYIVKQIERQDTIGGFSSITLLDNGNYFATGSLSLTGDPSGKNCFSVTI